MSHTSGVPERICVLLYQMPAQADDMQALLKYAREKQATFIEEVAEAIRYDQVMVVGDPVDSGVITAIERLRSWGIEPVTDLESLLSPPRS